MGGKRRDAMKTADSRACSAPHRDALWETTSGCVSTTVGQMNWPFQPWEVSETAENGPQHVGICLFGSSLFSQGLPLFFPNLPFSLAEWQLLPLEFELHADLNGQVLLEPSWDPPVSSGSRSAAHELCSRLLM